MAQQQLRCIYIHKPNRVEVVVYDSR
jgi:hypothetical protein